MPRIATLTLNPTVDKSCEVEQVVPERKLRCGAVAFDPGGGGINVARAIAHLGGEALALWTAGGAIGQLLGSLLDQEGISNEPVPIQEMTRENLIVFEKSSGQQFRFGMPGAGLTDAEIENCLKRLKVLDPPPDYLVLSGSLPPGVDEHIYARAAECVPASCRVILDTSGKPLRCGLKTPAFLIKPNMDELAELAGHPIEGDPQIREVAGSLIDQGKTEVVVTSLGSGGAVLTTAEFQEHIRAPTVKIRSKVGAGDSTVAGIVLALSRGEPLSNAVRFGVAAGAAAVMTDGTELCRRADAERLYQQLLKG